MLFRCTIIFPILIILTLNYIQNPDFNEVKEETWTASLSRR